MSAEGDGRGRILTAIRRSHRRGPLEGDAAAELDRRLAGHPRGPVPARGQLDPEGRVRLFAQMAETAAATTERVGTWSEVPAAVGGYLKARNAPAGVTLAPHPDLTALDWAGGAPMLQVGQGRGQPDTDVGVSRALCGIAETGTLMLYSRAASPTTLNFLPATHIVVLQADEVDGAYEDAWDRLRAQLNGTANWPRTVNLITGPSRTADIEQTLQLGAHGPMNLHVLLVGDAGG
jgi:L-lactate dehydrogenase complex protein LldG